MIAGNLGNMWIRFYIEKKSASMLPEGNGSCFILRKKGNKKKRLSFFYIENGKTQGNAFIENSEQSIEKKCTRMPSFLLLFNPASQLPYKKMS